MKSILLLATSLLISQSAFAATISGSSYEQDHQDVIIEAIAKNCSIPSTALSQVSSSASKVKIDQGITDWEFTTEIRSREYVVTVYSYYADFSNPMDANHYHVVKLDSPYCN